MLHRIAFAATACAIIVALVIGYSMSPNAISTPSYRAVIIDPDIAGGMVEPTTGDLLLWGSDGVVQRSRDGEVWQQASTPTTAELTDMAANSTGDRLMAVGHQGTVLTSTDGGTSWQAVEGLTTEVTFTAVLYVPQTATWLAAGHGGTLAFSHANEPTRWVASTSSIQDNIFDLLLIPNTDTLLFGGENGLLGVSHDGGHNWSIVPPEMSTPITAFHQVNEFILGLSAEGKIALSRDAAHSWQLLETGQKIHFNDVAYDPGHDTIVVASSGGTVLVGSAGGTAWRLIDVPYDDYLNYLTRVVFDTAEQRLLAFGLFGTVAQSSDGGQTWAPLPSGHREHNKVVLQQPASGTWVSAGVRGFRASNRDLSAAWTVQQANLDFYWRDAVQTPDGAITVVGELGKILQSTDSGASWRYVPVTYPDANTPPSYRAIRYNPAAKTVFAAGPTGLVMRSDDFGQQWTVAYYAPFDTGEAFADLEIDPHRQTLFALEAFAGPYFSPDAGKSWQRTPIRDERQFWHASLLATTKRSVAIAVGQAGLMALSHDGGARWQLQAPSALAGEDLYGSFADTLTGHLFVLGQGGLLLRSPDDGATWQRLATHTEAALRHMTREPKRGALLVSGEEGTLLRSTDHGATWSGLATPASDELRDFFIEPGSNNLLVIGRQGMVMRSQDAGATWQVLPSHTQKHLRYAVVAQKSGDFIAFGERIVRFEKLR